MSVLARFKDIISSNINALLDRCEDPEKAIDEYLLDAMGDLAEVKRDTAAVMAEEMRCKRLVEDAEAKLAAARKSYDLASANADKMRQLHDKLTKDIESLRSRRANIKAKMAIAEAQSQINEMHEMLNGGDA